jgi:hypothetical protein
VTGGARRYRRRPDEVDAVQYDGTNALEVADWCDARITWVDGTPQILTGHSIHPPQPGDYVVCQREPDMPPMFYTMRPAVFERRFEAVCEG